MNKLLTYLLILLSSCGNENEPAASKKNVGKKKVEIHKTPTTIYIQPFTGFPKSRMTLIKSELEEFYKIKTIILPYRTIYSEARLAGTMRYNAGKLLDLLDNKLLNKKDKILGLTNYDIYTSKKVKGVQYPHWGIFGQSICPGNPCIVSDFRLLKFTGKTDFFVVNTVLHEIGHTFGLPHCENDEKCLMNDAKGTIQTLYKESKWLCPVCMRKLNGTYVKVN